MPLLNELTRNIIALGHETLQKVFHQLMNVLKLHLCFFSREACSSNSHNNCRNHKIYVHARMSNSGMSSYMQREQILLVRNIKIDAGGMEQEIIHMVAD